MSVGNRRNCIVCGKEVITSLRPPYCSHCDPELKRRLTEAKREAAYQKREAWEKAKGQQDKLREYRACCPRCGLEGVVFQAQPPIPTECHDCGVEVKYKEVVDMETKVPITPDEYVKLAMRTECEELEPLARMCPFDGDPLLPIRLVHALLGVSGEAGELSENVKKWIFYGRPLDRQEMKEELGDLLWYVALACDALGVPLSEVMEANLQKLRSRYPEKFTADKANRRDTVAERQAIQDTFEESMGCGGETRTRSQVIAQQDSFSGCCDKNVDQTGCDCLDNALPDEEDSLEGGG